MTQWLLLLVIAGCFWQPTIMQLSPLARPTAAQLTQIASLARSCDTTTISFRIDMVNDLCNEEECSVECAVQLIPLLGECRDMLDVLYPRQGAVLDAASDSCLSIPSHDVLQRVIDLHSAGQCPNEVLNGISEVDIGGDGGSGECLDTNENCGSLISMGLSCDSLVGQCDATCSVCQVSAACEDTNANCAVMLGMGLGCDALTGQCDLTCANCPHRRTQLSDCNLAAMQGNIENINTICCDATGGVCDSGVPVTCDAKCAVFFVSFYSDCQQFMSLQSSADTMQGLGRLASTCDAQLPIEGLLNVANICTLQTFSNGFIFAVGGVGADTEEEEHPVLDSAEKFDLGLGEWASTGTMSEPRKNFAAAFANGRVYALGGVTTRYLNTVEALDPSTGVWTLVNPMATPRAYLAAVVANGLLYALGGIDDMVRPQSSVECMDLVTGIWSAAPEMTSARYGLGASVSNGYIFAVAGYHHGGYLNTVEAFDLSLQTWRGLAPLRVARIGLAVAIVNNHLFAYGGFNSGNGGQQLATVESLDLTSITDCVDDDTTMSAASGYTCGVIEANNACWQVASYLLCNCSCPPAVEWEEVMPMSAPRAYFGGLAAGGLVYALGGRDEDGNRLATVEAYDMSTQTWSAQPSMTVGRHQHAVTYMAIAR